MAPVNGAAIKLSPANRRIRSAVTADGTRAYVEGDGNSPWARRQRDLVALLADDAGGAEHISAAKLGLCHRTAALQTELEMLEGKMSLGIDVDLDQCGRLAGHYRRCLETLGVERRARDVTPDLRTYLAAKDRSS